MGSPGREGAEFEGENKRGGGGEYADTEAPRGAASTAAGSAGDAER